MADERYQQGDSLFTEADLVHLESVGQVLSRQTGHVFFREDEETDFALLIKKGFVKVAIGEPPRLKFARGPNEIVGEMAALRKKPRSASVIAWGEVEVLHISASAWLDFLYDTPRAMHALLYSTDERLDQATRRTVDYSELAAGQKLAKALVELADIGLGWRTSDGMTIRHLSQDDLASYIGLTSASIRKIVRPFKDEKIIEIGRETVTFRNLQALKAIARGDRPVSR
ncbi:Crp/Fnr family transcriptional regulator [Amycolatopsis sp.]|jgi:CRP-like cAMP-binding protein|uniref:Crp/Fnr family transcriptional regulator n=1 Tax=Amycolatopsis sp. TaxID=37632 RepID=UPI002DFF6BB9|nr:Crp/Fnr family transcriptional regulator [Amycolatopsis sp.]